MSNCPDILELKTHLLGRTSKDRQGWLDDHLSSCTECASSLGQLDARDALVHAVRQAVAAPIEMPAVGPLISSVKLRALLIPMPLEPYSTPAVADRTHEEINPFGVAKPQVTGELGRLGPYRLLRLLGAGGMGLVFAAEDERLGRPVALKLIRPQLALDADARTRFLREARAAALKHDNIVTVYEVDEEGGVPYLAMELLEGRSLATLLREEAALDRATVIHLAAQVADGLAVAHDHGIVHRDIKPENLWVEPSGRVKILDFGLARGEGQQHLTHEGAIIGTPAFMSPEQARGLPADARSDLFSLGSVLYRLLTGRLPFDGPDAVSTLLAVATHHPRPPDADPALSRLVMRLLAKNPNARPASAAEVAGLLRGLKEVLPPTRRRALLLVALSFVPAASWLAWWLTRTTLPTTTEEARPTPEVDTEQQVAEWVRFTGGSVWVNCAAQQYQFVPCNKPLPPPPYQIIDIDLCRLPRPLTDDDLERLRPVRSLRRLGLHPCNVTNAGLKALMTFPGLRDLEQLYLNNTRVTDAGLAELAGFRQLRKLDLHNSRYFTEDALARLPDLPKLEYLHIFGCKIGDAGLAHLRGRRLAYLGVGYSSAVTNAGLRHLEFVDELARLMLDGTLIDDDGLTTLAGLPLLHELSLNDTRVTDAGLPRLRPLRNLESLSVVRTPIRGTGLPSLANLPKLNALRLSGTTVNDDHLAHLAGCAALSSLDLDGTAVSDAGLAHLARLAKLRRVNLSKTRVTPEAVAAFRRSLPECEVVLEG